MIKNTSKYTHDITKTRSVDLFLELLNELDCGLCAILLGLGTDWRHVWRQEIGKGTFPATLCHFWVILCYISRQVCKGPYDIRTSFWNTSATVISCIFPHNYSRTPTCKKGKFSFCMTSASFLQFSKIFGSSTLGGISQRLPWASSQIDSHRRCVPPSFFNAGVKNQCSLFILFIHVWVRNQPTCKTKVYPPIDCMRPAPRSTSWSLPVKKMKSHTETATNTASFQPTWRVVPFLLKETNK